MQTRGFEKLPYMCTRKPWSALSRSSRVDFERWDFHILRSCALLGLSCLWANKALRGVRPGGYTVFTHVCIYIYIYMLFLGLFMYVCMHSIYTYLFLLGVCLCRSIYAYAYISVCVLLDSQPEARIKGHAFRCYAFPASGSKMFSEALCVPRRSTGRA